MSVSGIHNNDVYLGLYEGFHTLQYMLAVIPTPAPQRSRPCSSFAESGYLICFSISLIVISPFRLKVFIDDRKLLYSCLGKNASLLLPWLRLL